MQRTPKRLLLMLAALAVFILPVAVFAAGGFTDVDDDSNFKADIDWLADAGVTKGCNPPDNTEFCPKDNVTREQMAAFMHRLAVNKVVDAKTAVTADSATTAGDADTLEGKSASDLESRAYEAREDFLVIVPSNATTAVMTLDLPAGTYLIQARAGINSNMGGTSGYSDIVCSLTAGTTTQDVFNLKLGANGAAAETQYASWMFTHTFDAAGSAVLSCDTTSAWSGNLLEPTVTAISVQGATAVITTASSGGSTDPNG